MTSASRVRYDQTIGDINKMNLDLIFTGKTTKVSCVCKDCGNEHERDDSEYESFNITHNLTKMADACGIYGHLWQPSTAGVETARDLIDPIKSALLILESDPEKFRHLSATNGWGTYDQFIRWLEKVLQFCIDNPDMSVRASV